MTRTQAYDLHGWLTDWHCGFIGQQLLYAGGATPSYSGRISSKITTSYGHHDRYDYTYDMLGRLTAAGFSRQMPEGATAENGDPGADFSTAYSYDLQGNILSLTRQGLTAPGVYGRIDEITASFDGNRLASLRDDAPTVLLESSLDLPEGSWSGSDFAYDANGNQTRDMSRGVASVSYNALNLPRRVEFATGARIDYHYSASGTKLAETVYGTDGTLVSRRDYVGQFEFVADTLERTLLPEGFITEADGTFHAFIPDYQGNIAGVYNSATDSLEQFSDYYPYGLPHASATSPEANRRKYGAKELTTDLGLNLYDFAARFHNPAFPHFTTPDPLADLNPSNSIYCYCSLDPVNRIDPSGLADFYSADRYLGNDGVNDGRRFVLNTTKTEYNESKQEKVPAAGLSAEAATESMEFIEANNGNATAFANNPSIYNNFTEIESRSGILKGMAEVAELDDGTGGTDKNNNREHGGHIENGIFIKDPSGNKTSPDKKSASISLKNGDGKMHTHPSGTKVKRESSYDKENGIMRYCETKFQYAQHPSSEDIKNSGSTTNYVIGRRDNLVYIYDIRGIRAVINYSLFINGKKK